ncbi:MAG TPA: hypothetical protein VLM83_03485 [Anaerolineales bacterium]|nr:hypothetical protein [Anaerolineales bacterium]
MTGRIIIVICVLMVLVTVLVEAGQAASLGRDSILTQAGVSQPEALWQIQIATPTPMSVDLEGESPIQSEVGRDVGLVIGATILVLIVLAGLLIRRAHTPAARSRD